ncbi:hypothetical protein COX58_03135 [archaeon CG_4_10_14_0_2_um_filter_Archaea_38_6]|nr:MAG: hypothetical protein COS83_03595 [archaeon CG07_land_8_20_14_0_80_38_8]PIU89550.1 MAG: hypothetical protein COS64_00495 [archaeon CG06_land_8_20_14_3_00_37_11]PJA21913.1 MAG: hypothetical protein COX58_03135 [archaeon CG_4_10_14_0_2_um_filter_Archaea_38_6]
MVKKQFFSYVGVGVIATLTDWIVFFVLFSLSGLYYQYAVSFAFISGALVKFGLNKRFTFRDKSRKFRQLGFYALMVCLSYVFTLVLMYFLVEILLFNGLISRAATTFLVLFFGYFFDKNVTFNKKFV